MKEVAGRIIIGVIILLILVGLGVLLSNTIRKTTTKPKTAAETIYLRVRRMDQGVDAVRSTVSTFTKANPTVTFEFQNRPALNYEEEAINSLSAKLGPDLWSIPSDSLFDHESRITTIPAGTFADPKAKSPESNQQYAARNFPVGLASHLTSDTGEILGMPTNLDSLRLYYNSTVVSTRLAEIRKELTEQFRGSPGSEFDAAYQPIRRLLATPPKTWSDLVEHDKYLTKRDGSDITFSTIALGTAENSVAAVDILHLLMYQNGTSVIGDDRARALFHIPIQGPSGELIRPGENALDFYTSFARPDKDTYTWNADMGDPIQAFAEGKVAYLIGYQDVRNELAKRYPKFRNFETTTVPQVNTYDTPTTVIRFNVESVTRVASSSKVAFAFQKTYTNEENAAALASEVKLSTPYAKKLTTNSSEVVKLMVNGRTIFRPERAKYNDLFSRAITNSLSNELSTSKALDVAAEEVNTLLTERKLRNQPTPVPTKKV
jgi:ABC-type glycerol-3-phosphate transport system substrate-binding protein